MSGGFFVPAFFLFRAGLLLLVVGLVPPYSAPTETTKDLAGVPVTTKMPQPAVSTSGLLGFYSVAPNEAGKSPDSTIAEQHLTRSV